MEMTYSNGYCLFAFHLTPDSSANHLTHYNLLKHGNVRLEVHFAERLSTTVNGIVYTEYENILELDALRQLILDWLTQHHHGLDYLDGDVTNKYLDRSLSAILMKARKIHVRREEKWRILNELTSRDIMNLEKNQACHSFANLPRDKRYCTRCLLVHGTTQIV